MFAPAARRLAVPALAMIASAGIGITGLAAQQFTMKLSSPTINDSSFEYMKALKAGVEARSKGRVKVEVYPGNQLGQIPTTVEGVAVGTIEMTAPAIGFFIGLEPRFQTLETTGLFDSMTHGMKVLGDPDIRKRLATFGEAKGVEPLFTILHGELLLVSHKAIKTVADFKGQKLRVPGAAPLQSEPSKRLGASPVSMPLGEVVPALQNKVIDGAAVTYPVMMGFKYQDVTKNATRIPGGFTVVSGLVNKRFMKSLGPELEAIVREESIKAESQYTDFGVTDHARVKAAWAAAGGETYNLSPEEAKTYQAAVDAVLAGVLAASPKMKEDYGAFTAAAKKYR